MVEENRAEISNPTTPMYDRESRIREQPLIHSRKNKNKKQYKVEWRCRDVQSSNMCIRYSGVLLCVIQTEKIDHKLCFLPNVCVIILLMCYTKLGCIWYMCIRISTLEPFTAIVVFYCVRGNRADNQKFHTIPATREGNGVNSNEVSWKKNCMCYWLCHNSRDNVFLWS